MLVKFTIEPDALSTASAPDIRNLLSWWEPHGILVFPVEILEDSDLKCKQAVKDILQQSYNSFCSGGYPLWQELDRSINWDKIDRDQAWNPYRSMFELALIEETRASLVFEFPPPSTKCFEGIEVAIWPDISASEKFKAAGKLANNDIEKGTSIDDLWAERFQMLAKVSKQITIVDRYAAWNFYDDQDDLLNLLQFLENDSSKCYVTIYSSPNTNRTYIESDDIGKKLLHMVSGLQNIEKVTLHMSPNYVFNTDGHGRYIRFGEITCAIDIGIEIFRYPNTRKTSLFSFKSSQFADQRRNNEYTLRHNKTYTLRLALRNGNWQLLPTP